MSQNTNPFEILRKMMSCYPNEQLKLTSGSVTWDIYFSQGKLQYAVHSLQSLETLESCLYSLGYGKEISQISQGMAQANLNLDKGSKLVEKAVNWLIEQNLLNVSQKNQLITQLTQEAIESFLWVRNGKYYLNKEQFSLSLDNGLNIEELIEFWQKKQQAWQKLSPLVYSPHQRPYCPDLSLLSPYLSSSSANILKKIAQLKGKFSIRQLSLLLKSDDLKLAQFLYPYIKSKALQLYDPVAPFDQLPGIPQVSPFAVPPNLSSNITKKAEKKKSRKIVCIDDSEIVLNLFKRYLNSDSLELYMLSDATTALNKLFEIKPDLLLVDIAMPGIQGDQFSKLLKRSTMFKNLPIIIISADLAKIQAARNQSQIANDFLKKPFTREDLLKIIYKHIK